MSDKATPATECRHEYVLLPQVADGVICHKCGARIPNASPEDIQSIVRCLEEDSVSLNQKEGVTMSDKTMATDAEVARLKQSLDDGWAANFPKAEVTPELLYSLIERIEADAQVLGDMREGERCPFCGEDDFDLIGLKMHYVRGWCKPFNELDAALQSRKAGQP